jgi:NAD(P)-dependent dehydrogenase (short-subunit alcohol dehydrogenase family)
VACGGYRAHNPTDIADIAAAHPERSLALKLDVRERGQSAEAVEQTEARFGGIDVLVNNAGYGYRAAVEEASEQDVRDLFDTNFFALVFMTQAVLPGMRARKRGHIVNISSVAGRMESMRASPCRMWTKRRSIAGCRQRKAAFGCPALKGLLRSGGRRPCEIGSLFSWLGPA